jgi:hypothetical protein
MDETSARNREQLKAGLRRQFEECLERIADGVDSAAPGRLLADSEEIARKAIHDFGRAAYQAAIQQKVTASDAAFSPSAGPQDQETV